MTYRMSIEEFIVCVYMIEQKEVADFVTKETLGTLSERDLEMRFMSATHSLMAKEWLELNLTSGEGKLINEIAELVNLVSDPELTIRFSRVTEHGELVLAIHQKGDQYVVHFSELGVVYTLRSSSGLGNIVNEIDDLYNIHTSEEEHSFEVSEHDFGKLMDYVENGEHESMASYCKNVLMLAPEIANLFVTDFTFTHAEFNKILTVSKTDEKSSDVKGKLLVKGKKDTWVVSGDGNEPQETMKICTLTSKNMKKLLLDLEESNAHWR